MNLLLKCNNWQLFALLMSPRLLTLFFLDNPKAIDILVSLNAVLFFGFFMLSYEFLRPFEKESRPMQRFFFHAITLIFIWLCISLSMNGYPLDFIETVLMLPIVIASILFILIVLAKKLNRIEKAHNLPSQAVFIYMLFFLLLPVGIWVIVPQLKRLKGSI